MTVVGCPRNGFYNLIDFCAMCQNFALCTKTLYCTPKTNCTTPNFCSALSKKLYGMRNIFVLCYCKGNISSYKHTLWTFGILSHLMAHFWYTFSSLGRFSELLAQSAILSQLFSHLEILANFWHNLFYFLKLWANELEKLKQICWHKTGLVILEKKGE